MDVLSAMGPQSSFAGRTRAVLADAQTYDLDAFQMPEGVGLDEEAFEAVAPTFLELDLPQEQAGRLVGIYAKRSRLSSSTKSTVLASVDDTAQRTSARRWRGSSKRIPRSVAPTSISLAPLPPGNCPLPPRHGGAGAVLEVPECQRLRQSAARGSDTRRAPVVSSRAGAAATVGPVRKPKNSMGAGAMCDPGTLMIAAAATTALGQLQSGIYASQMSRYQAQVDQQNKDLAHQNAQDAIDTSQKEQQRLGRHVAQTVGQQAARMGANNIDLSFGSAARTIADTKMIGQEDSQTLADNTRKQVKGFQIDAWNYESQKRADIANGKQAMTAAVFGAATTALGAATQYAKFKQRTAT